MGVDYLNILIVHNTQFAWILLTSPTNAQMHCMHKVHNVQNGINHVANEVRTSKLHSPMLDIS